MFEGTRLFRTTLVGLVGAAAVAVACVPNRLAQSDTPPQLQVTGSEFKFQVANARIPVGQKVTISFTNRGSIEHNFTSEASGVHLVAQPGQTVTTTALFPTAGDVEFVCTIPGHKEAGMQTKVAATTGEATPPTRAVAAPTITQPVPQGQLAPPIHRDQPELVKVRLEVQQVVGQVTDGVAYTYWTFGGSVPGPMIRVRQGDTVELTLVNPPGVEATHSINVHAAVGPGGGAVQVAPGHQNTFRFQADHPGVWVYHCMTPIVGQHVSNGMFGMVVVEPPQGLPPVDREFYVMQNELYLQAAHGDTGLHELALDRLLLEQPDYVVYNGSVGSLTGEHAMTARVGETVRFFFGVAGPNLDSAFHVVGLAWDRVHPEGAEEQLTDVQTTLVPPGGATMTELTLRVPGMYMLEDHHITRLEKGAFADLHVDGPDNPVLFQQNYQDAEPAPNGASPFSVTEEALPSSTRTTP
jgi:nitrite reductase (NO-forming)